MSTGEYLPHPPPTRWRPPQLPRRFGRGLKPAEQIGMVELCNIRGHAERVTKGNIEADAAAIVGSFDSENATNAAEMVQAHDNTIRLHSAPPG